MLVLAGSALAGCGGSDSAPSTADYQLAVVKARDQVDYAIARVARAQSKDEFLTRLDEASAAIDHAASELDDAGAAKGFEDETDKLVGALHQLSTDYGAFVHDARQPEGAALLAGSPGLNFDSWTQANDALARLNKQGIEVDQIGRH